MRPRSRIHILVLWPRVGVWSSIALLALPIPIICSASTVIVERLAVALVVYKTLVVYMH
jgi:hypothetical protein